MKTLKKYDIVLKIISCILGMIASSAVALIIPYLINKVHEIPSWLYIVLVFVIFFVCCALYFICFVYPYLVKKENTVTRFLGNHSTFFLLLLFFIMITLTVISNQREYDEQKIIDLINIEWVIFGITVAFFTIWNALYLSKKEYKVKNPDKLIGIDRMNEILTIKANVRDNNGIVFPIILLVINIILLLVSTSIVYVSLLNEKVAMIFTTISFYFCTNTMITVFSETIIPMIKSKIEYEEKIDGFNLDDGPKTMIWSITEELLIQGFKKDLMNLDEEEKNKKIDEIINKMVEIRNEEAKEEKKPDDKTPSSTQTPEEEKKEASDTSEADKKVKEEQTMDDLKVAKESPNADAPKEVEEKQELDATDVMKEKQNDDGQIVVEENQGLEATKTSKEKYCKGAGRKRTKKIVKVDDETKKNNEDV